MRNPLTSYLGRAALSAVLLSMTVAGCDIDVPDLNNTALEELLENPTPTTVNAATTGLLIGTRTGTSGANGFVVQTGILGREAYNFDIADPRYISEMLLSELQPGSPFGGGFWAQPYANIKQAKIVIEAVAKLDQFTPPQKAGVTGFAKTIVALDLLRVIVTHDTNGAVVDIDADLEHDLGPVLDKGPVLAAIAATLDEARTDLAAAGTTSFTFGLSGGFAAFNTPATFIQFNRALRARVAVYQAGVSATPAVEYAAALTALGESFLNPAPAAVADLNAGANHVYSTAAGDATNGLINPNIYAHPAITADAQAGDARVTRKITEVAMAGSNRGISSKFKFKIYASNTAPTPIIRNEELILLRAEARLFTGDLVGAVADLNVIRDVSGDLLPYAGAVTVEALTDELLYNRRYSLMFEGGHRWIDARRFNRIPELKAEDPPEIPGPVNVRYPLTQDECNARPGEPKCALGSQ